jgi:glycoside/pentoside/hexuronide:cation symporter, GPH family
MILYLHGLKSAINQILLHFFLHVKQNHAFFIYNCNFKTFLKWNDLRFELHYKKIQKNNISHMEDTPKSKLPVGQKLSWGIGGFTENLSLNTIPTLAYNIFQVGMGISPFVVGLALSASRIVEGVTDPIIGNVSDNTRSRWGRRRPWIFIGAVIMTIIFICIWFTPRSVSDVHFFGQTISGSIFQSAFLIVTISLFFMTFTIWQIPFSGLGLELEVDYNERTKLQIFKIVPSFIVGAGIGSLYLITQMKSVWGGDEITGARYIGVIVGVIILITGVIPAIFCRDRYVIYHEKVKFWPSFFETFKDAPFRLLMGTIFFVFVSLFFMLPLLGYITLYHVGYDGMHKVLDWSWRSPFQFNLVEKFITHKELAGIIGVYTGITQTTTQLLSVLVINRISKYFDKKSILITGLLIGILGYFSSWFLFTPVYPYLTILPPVIVNIGLSTCWVLIGSFSADICDYDELQTGKRREGMYSAVNGFLTKLSIAAVTVISSWVLIKIGIGGKDPQLTADQVFTLRWFYIVVPVAAMIIAILFIWKYPLTKEKVNEIQQKLKEVRDVTKIQGVV